MQKFALEMLVFHFVWKPDSTLFENYDLFIHQRKWHMHPQTLYMPFPIFIIPYSTTPVSQMPSSGAGYLPS